MITLLDPVLEAGLWPPPSGMLAFSLGPQSLDGLVGQHIIVNTMGCRGQDMSAVSTGLLLVFRSACGPENKAALSKCWP